MAARARQERDRSLAGDVTLEQAMQEVMSLLPRIRRGMSRSKSEMSDLFHRHRLGPRHGSALFVLQSGPRTVGQLADELELSLAATSNLVAELDHAGLAERQQDPADRRRTIVRIAEESRGAVNAWCTGHTAPLARALGRLSAKERAVFVKALTFLEQEVGGGGGEPDAAPAMSPAEVARERAASRASRGASPG